MGRQHALCGLLAGVGLAAAIPAAPFLLRALLVVVTGGAALLPDLDHPGAVAARSLGSVTRLIATGIDRLAIVVFDATRAPSDPATRNSGHRLLTHTIVWNLAIGALVGALGWVAPAVLVVACAPSDRAPGVGLAHRRNGSCPVRCSGLLVGLRAVPGLGVDGLRCGHPRRSRPPRGRLADTERRAPLLAPIERRGQRWGRVAAPVNFIAGSRVETRLVAPVLLLLLTVCGAWETGAAALLVEAIAKART